MHHIRLGAGPPLLLVHGLGGSWRSWRPILDALAQQREVIAVDLPGFGSTPPLTGPTSIATLADALTQYLHASGLTGIDAVGSSMGARLVMELARRRGVLGTVIALDPGGFWRGWERMAFYVSIYASIRLVRLLRPVLPLLLRRRIARALLFAQFSHHPARLPPTLAIDELCSYAASASFDDALRNLAFGEPQQGAARRSLDAPLIIGWGLHDHVCFKRQAERALQLFPDARLYYFSDSGHFPLWDEPIATSRLILDTLAASGRRATATA